MTIHTDMRELKLTLGSYVTRMINNDNVLWRKKIITNSTPGPPAHVHHVVGVEETELLLARAQTLDSEKIVIMEMMVLLLNILTKTWQAY